VHTNLCSKNGTNVGGATVGMRDRMLFRSPRENENSADGPLTRIMRGVPCARGIFAPSPRRVASKPEASRASGPFARSGTAYQCSMPEATAQAKPAPGR
jgi:hypothetical protein